MTTPNETVDTTTTAVTTDSAPVTNPEEVITSQESDGSLLDESTPETTDETPGAAPSGAEKRIKQLAAQKKQEQEARIRAEVEREYYKGLAEGRVSTQTATTQQVAVPTTQQDVKAPVLDDFETFEEYEKAKDDYLIKVAEQRMLRNFQQQQQVSEAQKRKAEVDTRLNAAATEDPAFAEIYKNQALWNTLPLNAAMAEIVTASDVMTELIKWVHNNRGEGARISSLPPVLAAKEMALIEAKIKSTPKPEVRKVSSAPQPVQTVTTTTPSTIDEDNLPMEEYHKRRTQQMFGRK